VPDVADTVVNAIHALVRRRKKDAVVVELDSDLYDDLSLDSLEVAELSAVLEDDFGRDPYTEGESPRTVREVIAFYDR
jgi:acyl carrier protein